MLTGSQRVIIYTPVVLSSKFIASEMVGREVEYLRNHVANVPLLEKSMPSILLHCDSQTTVHIAKNKAYNGKSRHICQKYQVICNLIIFGFNLS